MGPETYRISPEKVTDSDVLNSKLLLLTTGMRCDFNALYNADPKMQEKYKINTVEVSDRHEQLPNTKERGFIPDELILSDGKTSSVVKSYHSEKSPFVFTIKDGKYVLQDDAGNRLPVDISIVPLPNYYAITHNGVKLRKYVSVIGLDRVSVIPYDGCENWTEKKPCKFCGANCERMPYDGIKPNVGQISRDFGDNHETWWNESKTKLFEGISAGFDAMKTYDKIEPHFHFMLMAGNIRNPDFEWKIAHETSEVISRSIDLRGIDSYIILTPPKNTDDIKRSKEFGYRSIVFNMECYGEDTFKEVCPGKNRGQILKMFKESVKVYGPGNVRTNFVFGLETPEVLLEGVRNLASEGIVSDYSAFFPRPASIYAKKEPPTPQALHDFTKELVEIYKKYGFRPFSCALSSRSSVASDMFGK